MASGRTVLGFDPVLDCSLLGSGQLANRLHRARRFAEVLLECLGDHLCKPSGGPTRANRKSLSRVRPKTSARGGRRHRALPRIGFRATARGAALMQEELKAGVICPGSMIQAPI